MAIALDRSLGICFFIFFGNKGMSGDDDNTNARFSSYSPTLLSPIDVSF